MHIDIPFLVIYIDIYQFIGIYYDEAVRMITFDKKQCNAVMCNSEVAHRVDNLPFYLQNIYSLWTQGA